MDHSKDDLIDYFKDYVSPFISSIMILTPICSVTNMVWDRSWFNSMMAATSGNDLDNSHKGEKGWGETQGANYIQRILATKSFEAISWWLKWG